MSEVLKQTAAPATADVVPHLRQLRVRAMVWEAEDVLSLTLADPSGCALPPWTPGAHVDFTIPGGTAAQYSLCGAADAEDWRIAVLLQRNGRGVSRYVHEVLRPGMLVGVGEPRNHFPLQPALEQHRVIMNLVARRIDQSRMLFLHLRP